MSTDNPPSIEEIENFFVNNPKVDEIRAYLGRFNPIKAMGVERMEIRHSAILGWLLKPQETHGLGDKFLKAFLAEALRGQSDSDDPNALDIIQADMTDAEIKLNWEITKDQCIDLLILSPKNRWIFVIENKFYHTQSKGQLTGYLDSVISKFIVGEPETYKFARGVFLTLQNEEAEDNRYAPIKYAQICDLLEQQVLSGQHPLTDEVITFLKHYLEIIQEAAGMSSEDTKMQMLARELYRNHRRVLDFIVDHGRDTGFVKACEDLFGTDLKYPTVITDAGYEFVFLYSSVKQFVLLPKCWFDALGGKEPSWELQYKYWKGHPLSMSIYFSINDERSGQIKLFGEVGPLTEYDFRRNLIEAICSVSSKNDPKKINFTNAAKIKGTQTSQFFKGNCFDVDDVQDSDNISATISKALKSFRPEIDAIAKILPQFRSPEKQSDPQ